MTAQLTPERIDVVDMLLRVDPETAIGGEVLRSLLAAARRASEHAEECKRQMDYGIRQHEIAQEAMREAAKWREVAKVMSESLSGYAGCCDGCTYGDGWDHNAAQEGIAAFDAWRAKQS